MVIGWHLLYEGISKLLIPDWSAESYLLNSKWIFAGIFHALANNPGVLRFVDLLNIWGLIIIGLALLIGFLVRYATLGGMLLLGLYYVANPPFIHTDFGVPAEGHYLFFNKTFVEIIALGLLMVFPCGSFFALDALVSGRRKIPLRDTKNIKDIEDTREISDPPAEFRRREILRYLAMVPVLGAFAWGTDRKYQWNAVNAVSGSTIKAPQINVKDLAAPVPMGNILERKVSKLIAGGNLIGGWSHSRDLRYVSKLFKAYNTEKKVFETLQLAEMAGINTINLGFPTLPLLNKYKRIFGSKIQTMTQVHPTKDDLYGKINTAMERGSDFIQIQGNCTDFRVRDGETDVIVKALDYIKSQGFTAGLGAHSVQALVACEELGVKPDFFMKTLHHDNYWSAHPCENRIPFQVDGPRSNNHDEFHDNMFCLFPEETIEFMSRQEIPWIAFKVLAGGAIKPEDGIRYAFENGADFVCVGMFDWQVVEDANIVNDTLATLENRQREWFG